MCLKTGVKCAKKLPVARNTSVHRQLNSSSSLPGVFPQNSFGRREIHVHAVDQIDQNLSTPRLLQVNKKLTVSTCRPNK